MNPFPGRLKASFVAVILVMAGAGLWFHYNQYQSLRQDAEAKLATISQSKSAQIVQWRNERLLDVKRLAGLLPVCSNCKKTHNDRNEWQEVETFTQEHSEAQFPHGVCLDCMKRLEDFPVSEDKSGEYT